MQPADSYDSRQAKQRASIKWLLSKGFNNRVPENLQEPFYRDHEDQEHLKPPIIGTLANAELYCMALSNMYSDPNYHNLNHWNILQTLSRKGIQVADPPDCTLTETVLIQTNPLKMSAHMAVIESLMVLYGREVGTRERVGSVIRRWGGQQPAFITSNINVSHEDILLAWISSACDALYQKQQESEETTIPRISRTENLRDLCDGVALSALISLYCPDALPISQIQNPKLASVHDSIHNLSLVYNFCKKQLPYNVFHMMPEDITYMRGSMHQNLLVMLADLFNMLEIHPAKCVRFPSSQGENSGVGLGAEQSNVHGVVHKRCLPPAAPVPIPDLRSGLHTPPPHQQPFTVSRSPSASLVSRGRSIQMGNMSGGPGIIQRSACSTPERRSASPQHTSFVLQDDGFVVHRGRGVTTLSSVVRQSDVSTIDNIAAGRPSNWEEQRRSSYAGRRSRRGSINAADDSQLTVENFGGSQDRLNFIGRNPEKELATVGSHVNQSVTSPRKISAPAGPIEQNFPVRSTLQDARGSIDMFYKDNENGMFPPNKKIENRERLIERQYSKGDDGDQTVENQYMKIKRQLSSDTISFHNTQNKGEDGNGFYVNNNNNKEYTDDLNMKTMGFTDLPNFRNPSDQSGVQLVYMQHGKEETPSLVGPKVNRSISAEGEKKLTSFGNPQNTTTWQQQSLQTEKSSTGGEVNIPIENEDSSMLSNGNAMAAQLNNIRLKLEEKKRRIEHEKRRMELALNRQRQQVGQQAFLQAVTKNKNNLSKSPSGVGECGETEEKSVNRVSMVSSAADSLSQSPSHTSNPKRPVTLQDISSEAQSVENKWLDQDGLPFVETRRTPDLDGMALEDYHQSIAKMNSSLHDIQTDIARLATQQNQIQANQLLQQQVYQSHVTQPLPNQYGSQHNINTGNFGIQHNNFGSSPHIPNDRQQQLSSSPQRSHQIDHSQFYLHDRQQMQPQPVRRTWAQHNQDQMLWQGGHVNPHQQTFNQEPQRGWSTPQMIPQVMNQELRTWRNPQGFVLHDGGNSPYQMPNLNIKYQNGSDHQNHLISSPQPQPQSQSQPQPSHLAVQSLFSQQTPPSASPQHRVITPQRQQSLGDLSRQQGAVSLQQLSSNETVHTPIKAPSIDDMEPQNISFIGNAEDEALQQGISRLNITSGSRTYRIPSPTRPSLTRNSFQQPLPETNTGNSIDQVDQSVEKGFYISFDSEQPKRPKPPLRVKRGSPKKDRTPSTNHSPERGESHDNLNECHWQDRVKLSNQEPPVVQKHINMDKATPHVVQKEMQSMQSLRPTTSEDSNNKSPIIIGSDLSNPNPDTAEEMERKKERIMMLSLQRRQQAEEARARAEAAADARRQREAALADERAARKEYQAQRREAILQQYKYKKAVEEAEREGKVLDKAELMATLKPSNPHSGNNGTVGHSIGGGAKLRPKGIGGNPRARPKTIHVDSGAVQMAEGILSASRGKQGSSSNLTAGYNQSPSSTSTMRRDYYRGSQDSLADRAGLYRDSPIDESRGMSPGSGTSGLGRRGSYKTSRENINATGPQSQTRGRSKYSTFQNNFKTGRKSSSLMNLCGSSYDQDSMVLRYGDADSGLGRATPPRRAPSPGVRTLPSPSGPGSLPPGLITKRRTFDDGSSDISSTPSSIMDYSGPRLYKQPATKSNRGIMLNAVEYCVFPGVVNKEAKRRVLDEINNSESKHFLVLFRDAGCQFRALYSYCPDRDEICKMYGTGPRQVNDRMFDKFFKYNSGSKCFSQVHTKHITVTIDAFTIHNSLWQGKKVQLPSKKDMALVI